MKNTPLRYAVRQLSSPMGNLLPPCYLCRIETGKSFSFIFRGLYTAGNRGSVRTLPEYDRVSNPQDFAVPAKENGGAFAWRIRIAAIENGHIDRDTEDSIKQRIVAALFKFRFDEQEV